MIVQNISSYNTTQKTNKPVFKANLSELSEVLSKHQDLQEYKNGFTNIILGFDEVNELMEGTYYYRFNGNNPKFLASVSNPWLENLLQRLNASMKTKFKITNGNKTGITTVGDYFTKVLTESNIKQPEILVLGKDQGQTLI